MDGREKCRALKRLRDDIAGQNGIELNREECTYEGPCSGTCPRCDAELGFLSDVIKRRKANDEPVNIPDVDWDGIFDEPRDDGGDDSEAVARVQRMKPEADTQQPPVDPFHGEGRDEVYGEVDTLPLMGESMPLFNDDWN